MSVAACAWCWNALFWLWRWCDWESVHCFTGIV